MPKQILLVDDSVTIHRVVEITFAHEDYALTAVKSADEGIAKARQLRPDAVLLDAGMAGKSGYDICAELRQDEGLAKTACLILTGNFTPYDEGRGASAGADGFVVKPFETQALIDKVKDVISRRSGTAADAGVPVAVATAPVAAAPIPAAAAARPIGIESLGKPLSTIAAETAAKIPAQPAAPVRPAPLPVPAAPVMPAAVAAAAPAGPRPQPKATLMGIPAVNPAALGITPVAPGAGAPSAPNVLRPPSAQPTSPAPAQPNVLRPASAPVAPAPVAPPPIAVAPAAPARPTALPANVPQMPRPSLVPGVAAPRPAEARADAPRGFEAAPHSVAPEVTAHGRPPAPAASPSASSGGLSAVVQAAAERASQVVPAAIMASGKGADYEAIAKLSREVIEQVVWEVVPELAETIIRAELDRLVRERQNA